MSAVLQQREGTADRTSPADVLVVFGITGVWGA